MDTKTTLEKKLAAIKEQQDKVDAARIPTGAIVDLTGPNGNIFYIMGLCRRLAREYGMEEYDLNQFKQETRLDSGSQTYQGLLDVCQRWFGLVYIR